MLNELVHDTRRCKRYADEGNLPTRYGKPFYARPHLRFDKRSGTYADKHGTRYRIKSWRT